RRERAGGAPTALLLTELLEAIHPVKQVFLVLADTPPHVCTRKYGQPAGIYLHTGPDQRFQRIGLLQQPEREAVVPHQAYNLLPGKEGSRQVAVEEEPGRLGAFACVAAGSD